MLEQTGSISNDKGTFYYSQDTASNTRQVQVDSNNDGKIDGTSLFYEDENGNTVKGLYDHNGDGKYDDVSLFDYDENGNLTTRYDGTVNYEYMLNKKGEAKDFNNDGIIDDNDKVKHENYDKYVEFSCAEDGNIIESASKELTGWGKLAAKKKSINVELNSLNSEFANALAERRQAIREVTEKEIEKSEVKF